MLNKNEKTAKIALAMIAWLEYKICFECNLDLDSGAYEILLNELGVDPCKFKSFFEGLHRGNCVSSVEILNAIENLMPEASSFEHFNKKGTAHERT